MTPPPEMLRVNLRINGEDMALDVAPNMVLADLLRDTLGLKGTKVACDQGACGACTVVLDGAPMTACLTLAAAVDGAEIRTIEGVTDPSGALAYVQRAFLAASVPQCGFCTPGMVMLVEAYLTARKSGTAGPLETWLGANICRCSGYQVFRRALAEIDDKADTP
jgi:aerobic carbon-monoxide dehydrogenase small subunit